MNTTSIGQTKRKSALNKESKPGGSNSLPTIVDRQAKPQYSKVPGSKLPAKPVDYASSDGSTNPVEEEDSQVNWEGMPPQPDEPPDWYALRPAVTAEITPVVKAEAQLEPAVNMLDEIEATEVLPEWDDLAIHPDEMESQLESPVVVPEEQPEIIYTKPPVILPPLRKPAGADAVDDRAGFSSYLVAPLPELGNTGQVRMLTVVLRSSTDKTRDVLRLRRIHGIIITYPGDDRFAIQVYEKGRGYLLEFPNSTTGITQELLDRLHGLVGVENIRVDVITFH